MSLTPEQLERRRRGIGASEISTVVGIGAGKLIELYEAKVHGAPTDSEDDENLARDLGSLLEQPVAEVYAKRTGTFLARVDTLQHPTKPLALCTPDRARFTSLEGMRAVAADGQIETIEALSGADRIVEIKTTAGRYRREYGPAGSGIVPEEKALIATWQMGVTGIRVLDMPVLFRSEYGVRLDVFTIAFNEALFEWLYESAERFWTDHVLARRPPPPDGADRYDEAQARMYPTNRRAAIVASDDDEELMLRFAQFREVERRAKHYKKIAAQELKNRIAEADGMSSAALGKLSWTRSKDSTDVDWQAAAQNALTLAGQCVNAFGALRDAGEHLEPKLQAELAARLKEIVPGATRVKPGHRSLRLYPKGEAALELARLNIALDALGEGA